VKVHALAEEPDVSASTLNLRRFIFSTVMVFCSCLIFHRLMKFIMDYGQVIYEGFFRQILQLFLDTNQA